MSRIEKLKSFIEQDPQDLFSRHALAMELIKAGEEREAVKVMEELLQVNASYIGTYYHLAKLYEKLEQYEQARDVYKRGIVLSKIAHDVNSRRELEGALFLLEDQLDI